MYPIVLQKYKKVFFAVQYISFSSYRLVIIHNPYWISLTKTKINLCNILHCNTPQNFIYSFYFIDYVHLSNVYTSMKSIDRMYAKSQLQRLGKTTQVIL